MNLHHFRVATAAAVALFCTSLPALAQGGNLQIRCMALTNAPIPDILVQTGEGAVQLEFSAVQPTDPVRARMANPLPLYRPEAVADPKTGPPPVMVKLPTDSREILLLAWAVGDTTRYLAIKDEFSKAGADDWLLINTTNSAIAIQVGEKAKPKQVAPGAYENLKITAPANDGAAVTAAVLENQNWRSVYSTYWPIYPDMRCIVFFVADGSKIRVRPVPEQLAKAAAD